MKHGRSASFSSADFEADQEKLEGGNRAREETSHRPHHKFGAIPEPVRYPDQLSAILGAAILIWIKERFHSLITYLDNQLRRLSPLRWIRLKNGGDSSMSQISPYRVENLVLLEAMTGSVVQRATGRGGNAEIPTALLAKIQNHVVESSGSTGFHYQDKQVLIERRGKVYLTVISIGMPPASYRELMRATLNTFHRDSDMMLPMASSLLNPLLLEQRRSIPESRWRAWLFLAALGVPVVFGGLVQLRDQIYQNRVESVISQEPGVEVVGWQNHRFQKDAVSILRDPLAKPLSDLFESAGVPMDWRSIKEIPFVAMEEPFVSRREREVKKREAEINDHHRAEIAALYKNFNKLSSEAARKEDHISLIKTEFYREFPIGKTADLVFLGDDKWELVGTSPEPYYSRILKHQKDLIIGGGEVSLSNFRNDIPEELKRLRAELPELVVAYGEGDLGLTAEGIQNRTAVLEKLAEIVLLHQSHGMAAPEIELHATPVGGGRHNHQMSIASARLRAEVAAIRKSPIGGDVVISTFLDSGEVPETTGVYFLAR